VTQCSFKHTTDWASSAGYASYENSTRLNATNYPDIPSLPISAATAEVLLKEIREEGQNRVIKLVNQGENIPASTKWISNLPWVNKKGISKVMIIFLANYKLF
jgi:hypothetical protein